MNIFGKTQQLKSQILKRSISICVFWVEKSEKSPTKYALHYTQVRLNKDVLQVRKKKGQNIRMLKLQLAVMF